MAAWDSLTTSSAQRATLEGIEARPGFLRWVLTNPWQNPNPPHKVVALNVKFAQDDHIHTLTVWPNGAITHEQRIL